jgi:hypothetical protein
MFEKKMLYAREMFYFLRLELFIIAWKMAAHIHMAAPMMICRKGGSSLICQGLLG